MARLCNPSTGVPPTAYVVDRCRLAAGGKIHRGRNELIPKLLTTAASSTWDCPRKLNEAVPTMVHFSVSRRGVHVVVGRAACAVVLSRCCAERHRPTSVLFHRGSGRGCHGNDCDDDDDGRALGGHSRPGIGGYS